ncbi:MFS transporter, partial [Nocardia farcinica]|uniref:MFS transporter n=1 Tax=Nocardia farcinica TaxID=37329 RepID=UPI002454A7B7
MTVPLKTTAVDPTMLRRAAVASTVGSAVEFYEFTIYGFLAVVFAPQFFPADDPTAATLAALAVFGGGYLARPLGGILFGAWGDRVGRRSVLMATIFLMGGASIAIGLLPTYATAGLLAPALLLVLRLVQGLSAGGEFTGAQTYIVEMAPSRRRGVYGSLPALGIGLGFAVAARGGGPRQTARGRGAGGGRGGGGGGGVGAGGRPCTATPRSTAAAPPPPRAPRANVPRAPPPPGKANPARSTPA